jgi:hypothetical protein
MRFRGTNLFSQKGWQLGVALGQLILSKGGGSGHMRYLFGNQFILSKGERRGVAI